MRDLFRNKSFIPLVLVTIISIFVFGSTAEGFFRVLNGTFWTEAHITNMKQEYVLAFVISGLFLIFSIAYFISAFINNDSKATLVFKWILFCTLIAFGVFVFSLIFDLIGFTVSILVIISSIVYLNIRKKRKVTVFSKKLFITLLVFNIFAAFMAHFFYSDIYNVINFSIEGRAIDINSYLDGIIIYVHAVAIILCSFIYFILAVINDKSKTAQVFMYIAFLVGLSLIGFAIYLITFPDKLVGRVYIWIILTAITIFLITYLTLLKYKQNQTKEQPPTPNADGIK